MVLPITVSCIEVLLEAIGIEMQLNGSLVGAQTKITRPSPLSLRLGSGSLQGHLTAATENLVQTVSHWPVLVYFINLVQALVRALCSRPEQRLQASQVAFMAPHTCIICSSQ
jgi:hypothetical protein